MAFLNKKGCHKVRGSCLEDLEELLAKENKSKFGEQAKQVKVQCFGSIVLCGMQQDLLDESFLTHIGIS